jgi:hypothetical protein
LVPAPFLKRLPFSSMKLQWHPRQESIGHKYERTSGLKFGSIALHACLFVKTTLS